jgi:hypothetical protein
MQVKVNVHGELVMRIGSVRTGKPDGSRADIVVVQFQSCGRNCFSLTGPGGGHPDAGRFSTQVRRAKKIWSDPSNDAQWEV